MAARRASPTEPRRPAGLRGPAASPPVLSLSHFCTKPFLCFGDVRLGASRTLPLALANPNAEEASVSLPRLPAAARGFGVQPRAFVLQPKEKIVISVTWTPLKEGRVREIVTFLVNDVLKHEVILLGNAEAPKKKKRSLWDTINKKKALASSSQKKRISDTQNVNKTFNVSQKVRSPLQACENLARNEGCSPPENDSLILEENKIPISPISPIFRDGGGGALLSPSVRRSTTCASLGAAEDGEVLESDGADVLREFHFHGKVVSETSFSSTDDIHGQNGEDRNLMPTPDCSSTLNIAQSHGHFLSPDSFVLNSRKADREPEVVACISLDTFMKDDSRPVHLESNTVHGIYRTILSPDSFLNDNYGLKQELESESINPILSPSQFVKDNVDYMCIAQETCELSPLSSENPQASQSPQGQRKSEVLPCIPECQFLTSPKAASEEPRTLEIKPNRDSFTKQNHLKFSAVQDISGSSHNTQFKRRPILSATVTKLKPACAREHQTETSKPKAKRRLRGVAGECEKVTGDPEGKAALHSYLPVIGPAASKPEGCEKAATPPSRTRKRKSEGSGGDGNVTVTVAEHADAWEVKRIHFSPVESKTSTAKKTKKAATPVSKLTRSREKLTLKKKTDVSAYKTPNSRTKERTRRLVPMAKSNLTFIRPLKTDIPRHPMPFAARNMFYDERWKEKQQQGFTWWLNFILTPDDFTVKTDVPEVNAAALLLGAEGQHKRSVARAPSREETSLRAYAARRRLNGLRRAACRLFTSAAMVSAIRKLEGEIEARRLAVRKDRHLWKDVGERQKVLNWLLSYNPLWLRVGLETVYGELIALEDNSDVTGMALFILNRLLWNPDIAAEHRHPTVPHLYREGHEEALSKFTLKKLLLLVCFLDYAKTSRLIDHDPCLFCKDAEFKASKEILLAFSRDFLSGEGDLSRHLSLLGLPVNHVQTPFDEFDFSVTNLAVDLQCGVRLVRTVELLTRSWDLSRRLRVPAISRLQKMHNVGLALQALRARGVPLDDGHGNAILAKDIVDRHREKTLALLWQMALAFQVDVSLNLDQLKEEIDFLRRTRRRAWAPSALGDGGGRRRSGPLGQRPESVRLLLAWVNAVCAFYDRHVENFTVSFSDGRVLCYLIHHYHPCYVPFDSIRQRTTQTVDCVQTGSVVLNSSSESDESCLDASLGAPGRAEDTSELYKELLENEKKNFQLVRSAVRDLGGIPAMIHHADMSNTIPDEKVVITYLSFLCARLLDLRREARAARLIQTAWRKYRLRADRRRQQERDKAARTVQSAVVRFLARRRSQKEVSAALVIQKHWRRVSERRKRFVLEKERLERVQSQSALVIQKYWRSYATRKKFLQLKHHSIVLQSRIRMTIAVASYQRHLWATVTIQRRWRARARRNRDRQRYQTLRSSCLLIQSAWRRRRRREVQAWTRAAVTLQRAFRAWRARTRAREERAALVLQSWFRMRRESRKYARTRACAVLIQTAFRRFRARKSYQRKKESALTLQRCFRAHLEARAERERAAATRLQAAFRAACILQSYWRMRRERRRFLNLRSTVIRLQARVRKRQQLQRLEAARKAALVIQTRFRAHLSAREALASYQATRAAAVVLQAAYRGLRARKRFKLILASVIKIQSCYRAYVTRKRFLSLKRAAVTLQSLVKMRRTRKQYARVRAAALLVQRRYRARNVAAGERERGQVRASRVVRLQAFVRGHLARKQTRRRRRAAVSLQSHFRMRRARRDDLQVREAAAVLQAAYRRHRAQVRQSSEARLEGAVARLQAADRGPRVRRLVRQQAAAALRIQAAFRGHRSRAECRAALRAAVRFQRWYRAHRAARDAGARFLTTRAAAASLQAAWRGRRVREHARRERQAARRAPPALGTAEAGGPLVLQSAWRGRTARRRLRKRREGAAVIQPHCRVHAQRRRWRSLREAARATQRFYGACRARRSARRRHLEAGAAAVTVRSACHSVTAGSRTAGSDHSAAAVQATCRAHRAAAVIQRWYRSLRIAKRQRREYLSLKTAAVSIQAVYRGVRVRRQVRRMHAAATCVTATVKMHRSKTRYREVRAAAVIQRRYRARHQGRAQRAGYLATLTAVTVLQAAFRMRRALASYRALRRACVLVQRRYRARRAATGPGDPAGTRTLPAGVVPAAREGAPAGRGSRGAAWRPDGRPGSRATAQRAAHTGCGARGTSGQDALHGDGAGDATPRGQGGGRRRAAGAAQTPVGACRRKRCRRRRAAAVPPRATATTRRGRRSALRKPLRTVPQAFGGAKGTWKRGATSEEEAAAAATAWPPAWRHLGTATVRTAAGSRAAPLREAGRRHVRDSAVPRVAASKPDAQARTALRVWPGLWVRPGLRVQAWPWARPSLRVWPWLQVRPSLRVRPTLWVWPSLRVRSCPRGQPWLWVRPSLWVRSCPRGQPWLWVRPSLRVRSCPRVAPCPPVAACGRRLRERRAAAVTAVTTTAVAASAAQSLGARQARSGLCACSSPCGLAARSLRSPLGARSPAEPQRGPSSPPRSDAAVIRAGTRGFLPRRKFQKIEDSALKIQAAWRGHKARKYVCEVKAACKIQAWYRGRKARQEYLAVLKAVNVVQGYFCARLQRTRFLRVRASAITIQRTWRATLRRRTARDQALLTKGSEQSARPGLLRFAAAGLHHLSAVRIQRAYRRHLARRAADRRLAAAVCIQRWFRARLQLRRSTQLCHSVVGIRQEARGRAGRQHRAAAVVQRAVRRFLLRRTREKFNSGIVKIQALWRGHSWRKHHDCTEIRAIRSSLHVVNGEAREEDRLGRRTALALRHLLGFRHLSAVLEALQHLEVVTRLSPLCCEDMARSGAVSTVFVLIRSCNRSVPCMEVVSCAVQVLLNVAKYEKTTWAVRGVDGCTDTLLELLQTYRAKPGDRVADKSAGIFTRACCLLAVLAQTAERAADVRNRSKVVDCVCSLYKLTARKPRTNADRILYKQNKNSSVSPPFLPETPARTGTASRLKPDWVLRRDNVEITSPLQALRVLMDALGVAHQLT